MATYEGKSKHIKNALITVISAITYDKGSGAEPAFVEVVGNTLGEFNGYPSVRVLPGDVTTDKAAVSINERTISFVIYTHLPLEGTAIGEAATYDQMYDLTDLIIDTLDRGDFIGALNTADATIGTFILNATRGDWTVDDSKGGVILTVAINVDVKYSKDLR